MCDQRCHVVDVERNGERYVAVMADKGRMALYRQGSGLRSKREMLCTGLANVLAVAPVAKDKQELFVHGELVVHGRR